MVPLRRRSATPSPPPSYPSVAGGYEFPVAEGNDEEEEEEGEQGERVLDETERMALQEAEDERLARELEEKEKKRLLLEV